MCLLQVNASGEEGLAELARTGQKVSKYERNLANLADEDSLEQADGLEKLLQSLHSWVGHPTLRGVRKKRINDHRFYLTGRNTDCAYTLVYVVINKRDEEDRAEDVRFQRRILAALETPITRRIEPS